MRTPTQERLFEKLMEDNEAEDVDSASIFALISYIYDIAKEITNMAIIFALHAGRKKINLSDIELAVDKYRGKRINVLHLSDFHFGIEKTKSLPKVELEKRNTTLKKLVECLKSISENHKDWHPDIVVITGDIGYAGKKEDYIIAENWLKKLLTELDLNKEALVVCPGNHDRFVEL